jgi:hypothetical protein
MGAHLFAALAHLQTKPGEWKDPDAVLSMPVPTVMLAAILGDITAEDNPIEFRRLVAAGGKELTCLSKSFRGPRELTKQGSFSSFGAVSSLERIKPH